MKNLILASVRFAILSTMAILFFVSCGTETEVLVHFVSIPGEVSQYNEAGFDNTVPESRCVAGGFVYAIASRKGETLRKGPFPLTPGEEFILFGLPRGTYDAVLLYYSPERLSQDAVDQLPLPSDSFEAFWDLVASPEVAEVLLNNSGAVAVFKDLKVKWPRKTTVGASLIPLSSNKFIGPEGAPPRCVDTAGAIRREFIRLEPNGAQSLYVMISNFDGDGIVYAGTVALFSAAGEKLETHTYNCDISPNGAESLLFTLPFDEVSYLYLEYAAQGDRALPLFYF
ncbi:MAG TPA: hypothetical protein GXZ47_06025 [Treponema sp.]|nr:hypothetical protein [Treponema sp.]